MLSKLFGKKSRTSYGKCISSTPMIRTAILKLPLILSCFAIFGMKLVSMPRMSSYTYCVTAHSVLPQCTGVFTKTLGLPCKHKIQQSIRDPDQPLRRDDLHPHWWLNALENEQPVEPWARIQPPVRTRRRGRPRNPRREPFAYEIAATRARNEARVGASAVGNGERGNRGSGRRGARGGNVGRARDGGNARENQPRRVGLRRRLPSPGVASSASSE